MPVHAVRTATRTASETTPRAAIRRFDVFAEYKRLEARRRGASEDDARGYGIWVAKVVAGRRFGHSSAAGVAGKPGASEGHERATEAAKYGPHELNGEPQTATTFEHEIVQRMGEEFYQRVFAPAIRQAFEAGERYEEIRDRVRRSWSPPRRAANQHR
jgi:hypothetical protein